MQRLEIVQYEFTYMLYRYKIFLNQKKVSKQVHQLSNSSAGMTKQIFIPNQEPIFISSIKSWRKLSRNTKLNLRSTSGGTPHRF